MWVQILGAMRVCEAGEWRPVSAAKQRNLLAMLVLRSGRVLERDWLVEQLWEGQPPPSASRLVAHYVWRVRALLPTQLQDGLHRVGTGYRLTLGDDESDHQHFHRLLEEARAPETHADTKDAIAKLEAALGLWRGPALADSRAAPVLQDLAEHLDQARVDAKETLADLYLAAGRHDDALPVLQDLTATEPYREGPWRCLLLALHRCGRRADALTAYQRLWRLWTDQLGVEPSRILQELHARLLCDDPGLTAEHHPPRRSRAPLPTAGRPAMLPMRPTGFVGRQAELAQLDEMLAVPGSTSGSVVAVISGPPGIGKTTLALHWAHRVAARFPGGQLYVNLRGFDQTGTPMPPGTAIRRFLHALEVPAQRIPAEPDAQAAFYRSVLARRRVLVVLDNARDAQQVRPLLASGRTCMVLVTSRSSLTGLVTAEGAHPMVLGQLSLPEARALLAARLGGARVLEETAAVDEIITRCARLPLALAVVSARAATHPEFPLRVLAEELPCPSCSLDGFVAGDPASDIRAAFSWSYQALSPPTRRLFRMASLHPGPDFTAVAAASLLGIAPAPARRRLTELHQARLLVEDSPGRFSLHDLLRSYAVELTQAAETAKHRDAATRRIVNHYTLSAFSADRLLDPSREPIAVYAAPRGIHPQATVNARQARRWFDAEHHVLQAATFMAAEAGHDMPAWRLAWTLTTFLHRRGHWHDWAATQRVALLSAQRFGDAAAHAYSHRSLGGAYTRLARFDDAQHHLSQALRLYSDLDDPGGQAHTHLNLAWLCEERNLTTAALKHSKLALRRYRHTDKLVGKARALNAIGWCLARLGQYRSGLSHCQQALTSFLEIGDKCGQAATWDSLGYIHHHLGSYRQAEFCYQRALDLDLDLGDIFGEADTLTRLGETLHSAGNVDAAHSRWQRALDILHELRHPHAKRVQARLHVETDHASSFAGDFGLL